MGEMNFENRGEFVYETLKQEILNLRLKPGQAISESDTYECFGMSRTPARGALRLLQEQGFTGTIPYRGTYVTLLGLDNIKQMIYMRVTMETMVFRDFLETQTSVIMEDIHHSVAQQRVIIREPGLEPEQSYCMGVQMHSIWLATVRRQKPWEMPQVQRLHYTRFRMLDFITETDLMRIIGEHKGLLRLVADKNEKGLEGVLKEHFYYSMKRMHRSTEVDYKDYFEEEDGEGWSVI